MPFIPVCAWWWKATKEFDGFPIAVAGKTGTAQQILTRPNHALFVGYAPYEDPQVSIATRIAYGYTSSNAADLSAKVLSYYFHVADEQTLLNGQAMSVSDTANGFGDSKKGRLYGNVATGSFKK